jgi:hypothetical protein
MKNQLHAHGKMFELGIKPLKKAEFNKLMKNGRSGKFYDSLEDANNYENALYGFYQWEGKPSFEVYLNDTPMGLDKSLKTSFSITYFPVDGSKSPLDGKEQFFYVMERGYKGCHWTLDLDGEFDPKKLEFEVERRGMFNGTVGSVINPTYDGNYFEFISSWTNFQSDYILSSKGVVYEFEKEVTNP